jgi:hypothetical protein
MHILFDILLVVLAVDFGSGLLHWLEDSYGHPKYPITGKWITQPNDLHHIDPAAFTTNSWSHSAAVLLIIGVMVVSTAWAIGILSWQLLLFVAIGANANEIHKWNHLPRKKRPMIVVWLQAARILQSPKHHARHHKGTKDSHYCVITNAINPILDSVKFWRGLEYLALKLFSIKKRPEPSWLARQKPAWITNGTGAGT